MLRLSDASAAQWLQWLHVYCNSVGNEWLLLYQIDLYFAELKIYVKISTL